MIHTLRCKLGQMCFRAGMRVFPQNIRYGTAAMLKAGLAWSKADPDNLDKAMRGEPINVLMRIEPTDDHSAEFAGCDNLTHDRAIDP